MQFAICRYSFISTEKEGIKKKMKEVFAFVSSSELMFCWFRIQISTSQVLKLYGQGHFCESINILKTNTKPDRFFEKAKLKLEVFPLCI